LILGRNLYSTKTTRTKFNFNIKKAIEEIVKGRLVRYGIKC